MLSDLHEFNLKMAPAPAVARAGHVKKVRHRACRVTVSTSVLQLLSVVRKKSSHSFLLSDPEVIHLVF